MTTKKKSMFVLLAIFLIASAIYNIREIRLEDTKPTSYFDGTRLVTPPLSSGETGTHLLVCSKCHKK